MIYEHVDWPQDRSYGIRLYKWVGGYLRQCDCVRIEFLFEFVRLAVPDRRRRPLSCWTRLIGGCSAYIAALAVGQ